MSKDVLNQLVDKYERSKQKENIHISLRFTTKVIPEYFDLNSDEYLNINQELQTVEELGFVSLEWRDNRPGHIIDRIRLNPEEIDGLYQYLNRKPKNYQIERTISILKTELSKYQDSNITKDFIEFLIRTVNKGRNISEYLDINNVDDFLKFISVLYQLEKNKELLYLREFSGKVTGDTKYIERNLSKFINILFKFSNFFSSKDTELILNYFNIYRNPIFVFLKGDLVVYLNTERLNIGKLSNGIALSSQDLQNLQIKSVKKVITIENLTTYNRFPIFDDTLILYSRGFANTELINLIKKIKERNSDCVFYHFGDIDVGGFLILIDLIQKTDAEFKPILMDYKTLEKFSEFAKPLTINDKKRLKNLFDLVNNCGINKNTLKLIQKTLKTMKQSGIKLEQEVIDLNSVLAEKINLNIPEIDSKI